jgi:Ner family transcriptional regulator
MSDFDLTNSRQTRPNGWHPAEVICAVRMKGESLASLGRKMRLSRKSLSWALTKPHIRANRAIAEFLDVPLNELWPQWFDSEGKLISREATPRPEIKRIPQRSCPSRPRRRVA